MAKRNLNIENTPKKKPKLGHWSKGLLETMKDPNSIIKKDDLVTIIKDVYPKAQFHYLVLPNENINNLNVLKKDHFNLLKHIESVAEEIIRDEKHGGRTFNIGYHAQASMFHLHLHVISDDMNSPCLKTKKHWNSFTTDFFLKPKDIRKSLEKNGKVSIPSSEECKKYLSAPLKCHKCNFLPKHIPDLKKHIETHFK